MLFSVILWSFALFRHVREKIKKIKTRLVHQMPILLLSITVLAIKNIELEMFVLICYHVVANVVLNYIGSVIKL